MLDLLDKFSLTEIIIFIVLLALAIKGVVLFFDWAYERLNKIFSNRYEEANKEEEMEEELKQLNKTIILLTENYGKVNEILSSLNENVQDMHSKLKDIQEHDKEQDKQLKQMMSSDMHAIKSYIVGEYYKHKDSKEIEELVMECIERRYEDYKKENGNSYVEGLIKELRTFKKK